MGTKPSAADPAIRVLVWRVLEATADVPMEGAEQGREHRVNVP